MAKIVIDCVNPNDFAEVVRSAEKAAGSCTITYAKQHIGMVECGSSSGIRESSRIISEDSGETPQSVRRKIQRGIEEMAQDGPDTTPQTESDSSNAQFRTSFTGNNEWYTPQEYIEAARSVMGNIDLDPATSEAAQKRINADRYFTEDCDGLEEEWYGRVWMNPPYAQPLVYLFIDKLVSQIDTGKISEAILLTHNYTDTAWFHLAESKAALICFTKGRIRFEDTQGNRASPTQGSAFFYFGVNMERFKEVFNQFGFIR